MKNYFVKLLVLLPFLCLFSLAAEAQKGKKRSSSKRANTTTKKTTKGNSGLYADNCCSTSAGTQSKR
jgi:hypothetical protein